MMNDEFKRELQSLLNKHSIDNDCQMPDFILAELLFGVVVSIAKAEHARTVHVGRTIDAGKTIILP